MPNAIRSLTPFPVEVLLLVAENVPRPDLAQLSRVNTTFHQAAVKALYTHVPVVVLDAKQPSNTHYRPAFNKPEYARHVKCLDVPVFPLPCCEVLETFPELPSLEVIRLNDQYSHKHATGEEELCPLPADLRVRTVVLRYPAGLMAGYEVPRKLLERSEHLVVFVDLDHDFRNRFGRFGSIVETLQCEIPECTRNLTIVLKPTSAAEWEYRTVSTLLRICDRTTETLFNVSFEEMLSLSIVLADDAFSSATRDTIVKDVSKSREAAKVKAEDSDAHEYPDLKILLLSEFLSKEEYAYALTPDEVKDYVRISATHEEGKSTLSKVLAEARDASTKHSRFTERQETGSASLGREYDDFDDGEIYADIFGLGDHDEDEDEFFDEDDYADDWYEEYRRTGDVPMWVLGETLDDDDDAFFNEDSDDLDCY